MIPMKTPPNMLRPASAVVVKGCLSGLRTMPLQAMAARIADMPDDTKALVLLHELDHLIWLKTIWPDMDRLVAGNEMQKPNGTWVPFSPKVAKWCLLDRYREIGLDEDVRAWIEQP